MISHNISALPDHQRRDIELQRQAAMIAHKFKTNKLTRNQVNAEIEKRPIEDREKFRGYVNKYKRGR